MSASEALARHRAGDRAAAETLYRAAIATNAGDVAALHGLGVLCFETGRGEEAIRLLERGAQLAPADGAVRLNLASSYAAAGRVEDAERCCRELLAADPRMLEAQLLLANLLRRQRRPAEALTLYEGLLKLEPRHAAAARHRAELLRELGRPAEALAAWDRAVELDPQSAHCRLRRGRLRQDRGELDAAIADFTDAASLEPDNATAAIALGAALQIAGRNEAALAAHRRARALAPEAREPIRNLALLLEQRGEREEALELRRKDAALAPGDAPAHAALGRLLTVMRDHAGACAAFERAVALEPANAPALADLAFALLALDRFDEARAVAERAIAADPKHGPGYGALGHAWQAQGRNDRAIDAWRSGIAAVPDEAALHANLGLGLLQRGEYEAGWREYEWRLRTSELAALAKPVRAPRWTGEGLAGKTLLLLREQGNGDMIQFARCAGPLAARGARILFDCPKELRRLLAAAQGVARTLDATAADEPVDFEVRLMSLPRLCGERPERLGGAAPYLRSDPAATASWQRRLATSPRPRVGIAWQGNPTFSADRRRSLPLAEWAPILALPASFVSLQKGPGRDQIGRAGLGDRLLDWTEELTDFADTAALVAALDLVIAIDSAIGHLAGALGTPAWLLLARIADYRWLEDRADTPWYPRHRLFRQPASGDWQSVLADVRTALAGFVEAAAP